MQELHNTIPILTKLIYKGKESSFYTKGESYKIMDCYITYTVEAEGNGDHTWDKSILDTFDLPTEETKPVYTAAMHNIPSVPPVGSDFLVSDTSVDSRIDDFNNQEVTVLATTIYQDGTLITFSHPTLGVGCGMFSPDWVKAIDVRTDKEKTIDDINKIDQNIHHVHNFAEIFLEAVKNAEIHDISFIGE